MQSIKNSHTCICTTNSVGWEIKAAVLAPPPSEKDKCRRALLMLIEP